MLEDNNGAKLAQKLQRFHPLARHGEDIDRARGGHGRMNVGPGCRVRTACFI